MKIKYLVLQNNILTIIIPSFNRFLLVKERLNELIKVFEVSVIIVDDNSQVFYDIHETNYIDVVRNEKNLGRGNSILLGLNYVKTKFVSIFDDDDPINSKNLNLIIEKLKDLDQKSIGIVAEAGLNNIPLKEKFDSYIYARFKTKWKDRKEFVKTDVLKKSIPFWLKGRRIPTSFLFSLCDQKGLYWNYYNIDVIKKNYSEGGMTSQLMKNPFKKSIFISLIFLIYRKYKLFIYEIFKARN